MLGEEYREELLNLSSERLENVFGGSSPAVSRVIFTNFELDSFYPHGVRTLGRHSYSVVFSVPCK